MRLGQRHPTVLAHTRVLAYNSTAGTSVFASAVPPLHGTYRPCYRP